MRISSSTFSRQRRRRLCIGRISNNSSITKLPKSFFFFKFRYLGLSLSLPIYCSSFQVKYRPHSVFTFCLFLSFSLFISFTILCVSIVLLCKLITARILSSFSVCFFLSFSLFISFTIVCVSCKLNTATFCLHFLFISFFFFVHLFRHSLHINRASCKFNTIRILSSFSVHSFLFLCLFLSPFFAFPDLVSPPRMISSFSVFKTFPQIIQIQPRIREYEN